MFNYKNKLIVGLFLVAFLGVQLWGSNLMLPSTFISIPRLQIITKKLGTKEEIPPIIQQKKKAGWVVGLKQMINIKDDWRGILTKDIDIDDIIKEAKYRHQFACYA